MIGDGGVIGWLLPETIEFPDDGQPTLAYTTIKYKVSGATVDDCNLVWLTTATQAEVRSLAKDVIRADIITKLGLTIPKAQIKMLNSPE
jgi:hypothetical protein